MPDPELARMGVECFARHALVAQQVRTGVVDVDDVDELLALLDVFSAALERRGAAIDVRLAGANRRYAAKLRKFLERLDD